MKILLHQQANRIACFFLLAVLLISCHKDKPDSTEKTFASISAFSFVAKDDRPWLVARRPFVVNTEEFNGT